MNIAVNTRLLLTHRMEGIARYIYETTRRIVKLNPQHHFFFLFDRSYDQKFIFADNVTPIVVGPPTRHPLLWYLWFEYRIPKILEKYKIDVFYSGDMYLSLKSTVPTLLVSHDLAFHHYPQHLPFLTQKYYNHFAPLYHRKADKIIAVSEATKKDIIASYGIENHKIKVAYNDSPDGFSPISDKEKKDIQLKYANGKPYFFYLGAIHPRKNIARLIEAFNLYKKKYNLDHQLLIAGRFAWKNSSLMDLHKSLEYKKEIHFLKSYQPDVPNLMAGAEALSYISVFEGFGIPILEAFNAGTAVISSNISSMPEVAGDAGLLVDPFNIQEIADAFYKLSIDQEFRTQLIVNARQQKLKFSWDDSAQTISEELNNLAEAK